MTTETTRPAALVSVRENGPVAELVVGDGAKRNALTSSGWESLERHIRVCAEDSGIRAIVIRGHSDTFCAGSDIGEWFDADPGFVEESFARMEAAFTAVERCPVPVVAAIRGFAAGAGCQLALACDMRFMADSARIGMPIVRLGILTSPAFAARMIRLAGPALAGELLYTGRLLDAPEAARAGLVNRVLSDVELDAAVDRTLAAIGAQPTVAVRAAKRSIRAAQDAAVGAGVRLRQPAVSWPEFSVAVRAFLD
jgi:enoyl-CoA hydratase